MVSWAPNAANVIKGMLANQKKLEILEPVVTIRTKLNKESEVKMKELEDVFTK